jgi:hypothetical protein
MTKSDNVQLLEDIADWHGNYELFTIILTEDVDPEIYNEMQKYEIFNDMERNEQLIYELHNYEKQNLEDSASYKGDRDCYVRYSSYECSLSDYPSSMMDSIKSSYVMVEMIEEIEEKLRKDTRASDVVLMSPRARSVDGDNYQFYIGFNFVN